MDLFLKFLLAWFFLASCHASEFTYSGAILSGNKDGSIPKWQGGLTEAPDGWVKSKGYDNPFKNEKPLFVIDGTNYDKYESNLSNGQIALLKGNPTFKMPVYKTHRTAVLPKNVVDDVINEKGKAKIVGHSIVGRDKSHIPFPYPSTGEEAIYNYLLRYVGNGFEREYAWFPVRPGRKYYKVGFKDRVVYAGSMKPQQISKGLNYAFYANFTAPATLVGTVYLVHEFVDAIKNPRAAWIYNAGARRVRRAPDAAYDATGRGSQGLITADQIDGFNGSLDRYNWKLIGKKTLLVPYNFYLLHDKNIRYTNIFGKNCVEEKFLRFEFHRVWVVEARLKKDSRHIYGKRVFYVDEDSWSILSEDSYSVRGDLWRVSVHGLLQVMPENFPWYRAHMHFDLSNKSCFVSGLDNELKNRPVFGFNSKLKSFTPNAMRRFSNN